MRTPSSAVVGLGVIAPLATALLAPPSPDAADIAIADAAQAARGFLESLDDEQRAAARFALDDAERLAWNFVPGRYPGVELGALDLDARRAAHTLLRAVSSARGYLQTQAVIQLEELLRDAARAADRPSGHRDPGRYALAVFGEPAADAPWGLRLQGHHLSWNLTFAGPDRAVATPHFVGANPHEVRDGPHAGLRVLGAHEDGARALLAGLDDDRRPRAILGEEVPADVLLVPDRPLDALGERRGIAARDLDAASRQRLRALIRGVVGTLHPALAAQEMARIDAAGFGAVHFGWIGSSERGAAHYWRVHGPTFAIEYDNVQNDANHAHVVWHDLTGNDFGIDLLRAHVEQAHAEHTHPGEDAERDGEQGGARR